MPFQTFYNLSEEKKERLMDAVRAEFSRAPFEQVSINRIVQTAGISRGSFYQYFADKEDLFFYCIEGTMNNMNHQVFLALQQSDGDIFKAAETFLAFLLQFGDSVGMSLMSNFMKQIHGSTDKRFRLENYIPNAKLQDIPFLEMVDTSSLNLQQEDDLALMLDIIVNELRWCICKAYLFAITSEQVQLEFHTRLEILRHGMARNAEVPHAI